MSRPGRGAAAGRGASTPHGTGAFAARRRGGYSERPGSAAGREAARHCFWAVWCAISFVLLLLIMLLLLLLLIMLLLQLGWLRSREGTVHEVPLRFLLRILLV